MTVESLNALSKLYVTNNAKMKGGIQVQVALIPLCESWWTGGNSKMALKVDSGVALWMGLSLKNVYITYLHIIIIIIIIISYLLGFLLPNN